MDGTILIVEDEPEIQHLLAVNLQHAGYRVLRAASVTEAESLMRNGLPSLILLDWILPQTLGMTFARRLRGDARTSAIPIIMLTGRASEADKIAALEAGVDDYVTKPFSPRELLARIKALLRRSAPQRTDDVAAIAGLRLDPGLRRVTCNGSDIELGEVEFRMLHFFMTHPERVYSRAQLLDQIWGDHVFVEERTVDVHVRRLRQALTPTGRDRLVETVRGAGYCFRRGLSSDQSTGTGAVQDRRGLAPNSTASASRLAA
ncbi:MAG TPA: phosphate regulon transcriptional regulator PhoB [Burkholderiales bacterium]|jgi:two-component system phosphate regulon response regulator PhoB